MSIRPDFYAHQLLYRESTTGETLQLLAPVAFLEDFVEQSLPSPWGTRDTAGGTETLPASGGYEQLALTSTNEAQLAGIDFADSRPFVLNQSLAIEFRFTERFTTGDLACERGVFRITILVCADLPRRRSAVRSGPPP